MAAKKKTTAKNIVAKKTPAKKPVQGRLRLWLMYPPKHITSPVICELVTRFGLLVNLRQAEVRDEIGIICLELEGPRD